MGTHSNSLLSHSGKHIHLVNLVRKHKTNYQFRSCSSNTRHCNRVHLDKQGTTGTKGTKGTTGTTVQMMALVLLV